MWMNPSLVKHIQFTWILLVAGVKMLKLFKIWCGFLSVCCWIVCAFGNTSGLTLPHWQLEIQKCGCQVSSFFRTQDLQLFLLIDLRRVGGSCIICVLTRPLTWLQLNNSHFLTLPCTAFHINMLFFLKHSVEGFIKCQNTSFKTWNL